VTNGLFVDKGLVNEHVFAKIIDGLRKSPFSKPFAVQFANQVIAAEKRGIAPR